MDFSVGVLPRSTGQVNCRQPDKIIVTQYLPLVFGNNQAKQAKETETERDRLYQKVGKLQVELDWLKKNTGHL
jgi:hypothetical protein